MSNTFSLRVMEFHHGLDLDPGGSASQERLRSLFLRASEIGLNAAFVGEAWPRGLQRLISYAAEPQLALRQDHAGIMRRCDAFASLASLADSIGLRLYANMHPISYPTGFLDLHPEAAAQEPPGWDRQFAGGTKIATALCPRHLATRELLCMQADELLVLPGISGLSCWLNMGGSRFFDCDCPRCHDQPIDECVSELADLLQMRCALVGKELNIRSYLGSWQCALETACFVAVDRQMNPAIRISYKQQQGDMYNEHPLNPLLGRLGSRPQAIEFDGYGEYRGNSLGMICSIRHQMQERMQAAAAQGIDGVILRGIHAENRFAVDAVCFAALARDVHLNVDAVAREHLSANYGDAADAILALLDGTWQACRRSMYVRGVNWASWSVPAGLDRLRFVLFDRSAPCVPGAFQSLCVDAALLAEHAEDQAEAVRIAGGLHDHIHCVADRLAPEDLAALRASAQVCLAYARLCQALIASVLRFFRWEACPGATMREQLRVDLLSRLMEAETRIDEVGRELAAIDIGALEPLMAPIELVVLGPEKRLMQPVDNARLVCADIRVLIDRMATSYTGIAPWPSRWPSGITPRDIGLH